MTEKQYLLDAFCAGDSWRIFKIMSEFVEGFEELNDVNPCVSIFGSARTKPEDPVYQQTVEIARKLAESGFNIITGGGGGVMEAGNKGAAEGGAKSVGLNIKLPFEQTPNPFADLFPASITPPPPPVMMLNPLSASLRAISTVC